MGKKPPVFAHPIYYKRQKTSPTKMCSVVMYAYINFKSTCTLKMGKKSQRKNRDFKTKFKVQNDKKKEELSRE